jgi:hypothetical protein
MAFHGYDDDSRELFEIPTYVTSVLNWTTLSEKVASGPSCSLQTSFTVAVDDDAPDSALSIMLDAQSLIRSTPHTNS